MAYGLPAPACSLHHQPVPGVSSLGFGPLFLRAGVAGFLCPGGTDLRLTAVWPKIRKFRHISLHQAPAVSEPWALGFRPLHDVAAHDHLPVVCGHDVRILLPGASGGATHARDRSSYVDYMRGTGMFLPGNPGGRLYRRLFGNLREQKFARRLALTSLLVLVLAAAFSLRAYTVRHIARTAVLPNVEVVSVYPMAATAMRQVASLALSDPSAQQALQREGNATFVAHVLPHDYGMIGMFADVGTHHMAPGNVRLSRFKYLCGWLLPFLDSHVRTDLMGSNGQEYRVVFSRVDGPNGQPISPARLFNLSAKMTPVYVVDVSAATQQVSRTMDPPHRSFWGDVKMPMF